MLKYLNRSLAVLFLASLLVAIAGCAVPASAQGGAPPVTNIQLRNGPNPGEVLISWDAVPAATHYRIGYVNMEVDYHLAKASCTEEWIEAFVYVDVNARNIPVKSGRAEYTVRRLVQGARHAFTVLASDNFYNNPQNAGGDFSWPQNPRWKFLPGRGSLPPGITLPTPECSASPPASNTPLSNAELARRVRPALAKIVVTNSDGSTSSGTGFVVSSDGLVVTNRHVVDDASTVSVLMNAPDGSVTELTGQVLGRGILADLAVVKPPAGRTYPSLLLGDSDAVAQGDDITAWGYPLSSFLGSDPTLTRGIISSANRIFDDTKYLQTDSTIAPGNSGGPVVDRFGRVVGVNTAGLVQIRDDGTLVPVPGIYLAIASNEVSSRLNAMAAGGPASATYRNLRFDYGYSVDIPKGWYLYRERETYSRFLPYATNRYVDIGRYRFTEPHFDRSSELFLLADWYWNIRLPEFAAENWRFFQPISQTKVNVAGHELYRLEYRKRIGTEFCIEHIVAMVSISSAFPSKPYGFITEGVICEQSLATYSAERNRMLNSFRP